MAEVEWIKISTGIFDNSKIRLIETMPDYDAVLVIWFKLLCLAGKENNAGVFLLNGSMPYNAKMLATIFNRNEALVQMALDIFSNFGMIEITDGVITIPKWEKHQSTAALEKMREQTRERVARCREKQKRLALPEPSDSNVTVTLRNATDKNREDKNREDKNRNNNSAVAPTITAETIDSVIEEWNKLGLNKLQKIVSGTTRHEQLKKRIRDYGIDSILSAIRSISCSDFLMGRKTDFQATFDWFIKPNNFAKVLEGNYTNRDAEPERKLYF